MKPSYLSLLIAAAAFGASTVYLARQLAAERARADQVLAESRELQARVAELETVRAMLAARPVNPGPGVPGEQGLPPLADVALAPGEGPAVEMDAASSTQVRRATEVPRPEQTAAFRRMMRGQLRAQNRQIYADLGPQLGLTREDTNKLIDLLTDQQVGLMSGGLRNPGSGPVDATDLARRQMDEVAALIGYDKVEQFKAYQASLPARQEVATIARQLEGADLQLEDSQREKLVAALREERKRIPAPEFVAGTSPEAHRQAMTAWENDYQQRTDARVRSILSADQLGTYDDYQQWAREMRAQFESHRVIRGRDGSEGDLMMAEPVAVAVPGPAP